MISIAVCDDELTQCLNLSNRIKEILSGNDIECSIRQFQSGKKLLAACERFDVVFLDIIMNELNGIETAKLFRERFKDEVLIFISASRDYVFEAYDAEAFNYLIKPVSDAKLKRVLNNAVSKIKRRERPFIIIRANRQKKKLFLDDVYFFEIMGRVIKAHTSAGDFDFYEKIGALEEKLAGKDFFRCHKSYLINLKYVCNYNTRDITLDNGDIIPLAKRRYEDFCPAHLNAVRKMGGIL